MARMKATSPSNRHSQSILAFGICSRIKKMKTSLRMFRPWQVLNSITIEHLWALTVLVGIFVFVNTHPIRPHDFWWHMAVGREILETGQIPQGDTFSQTMRGAPYPSYQAFWLMEAAMYGVYRLGGAALTVLLHGVVITAAYALLLWLGRRVSGSWRAAAAGTLFAAALGLNDWNVRPQAITFAIAALFLLAIHEYRQTQRRAWLVVFPLGMVLWVNSHGTFPLGLALMAFWVADEGWKALQSGDITWTSLRQAFQTPLLTLALSLVACALSPRGLGTFAYVSGMTSDPIIQNLVPEWAPPTFDTLGGQLFFGGLLLSAAILALSPKRPTPSQLLTFLAFGGLGMRTSRGSIWFGLVMAPVLAEHVARLGEEMRKRKGEKAEKRKSEKAGRREGEKADLQNQKSKIENVLNLALVGLLLWGAVLSLPWFKALWPLAPEKRGLISAETPIAATEFLLQERLPGPLFHAMSFGSYLIWAAQPEYPVFVDGRIELYPADLWLDYLHISAAAPGWEATLEKYGIQTLMLSPQEQAGLVAAVQDASAWREMYRDNSAMIFTRVR